MMQRFGKFLGGIVVFVTKNSPLLFILSFSGAFASSMNLGLVGDDCSRHWDREDRFRRVKSIEETIRLSHLLSNGDSNIVRTNHYFFDSLGRIERSEFHDSTTRLYLYGSNEIFETLKYGYIVCDTVLDFNKGVLTGSEVVNHGRAYSFINSMNDSSSLPNSACETYPAVTMLRFYTPYLIEQGSNSQYTYDEACRPITVEYIDSANAKHFNIRYRYSFY